MTTAQDDKPRKKKRRVLFVLKPSIEACIAELAAEKGLNRMSLMRMWIIAALVQEGWTMKAIEEKYGRYDLMTPEEEAEALAEIKKNKARKRDEDRGLEPEEELEDEKYTL